MLNNSGASRAVGTRVGWSLCACNAISSNGVMECSQHRTIQASALLLREHIRRKMSHVAGDVRRDLGFSATTSGTEYSTRQCTFDKSPPFGRSGQLVNILKTSCTLNLTTQAASSRRNRKQKVRKGDVHKEDFRPKPRPATPNGSDNHKRGT